MQHLDFESVKTERPGELIAYYKIASKIFFTLFLSVLCSLFEMNILSEGSIDTFSGHYKWALDQLFYKHNFSRVIILEGEMGYLIMLFYPLRSLLKIYGN